MADMALVWKKRKKEREEWWRKILAYYMMEKIVQEQQKTELLKAYAADHTMVTMEQLVLKNGLLARLFLKKPGQMSPLELLEKIAPGEDKNSPFYKLLQQIKKDPMSEKDTEKALAQVIEEAPPVILADARQERERKEAWEQEQIEARNADPVAAKLNILEEDKAARAYQQQLRYKMSFLKKMMAPELFDQLCQGLAREGQHINEQELDIPDHAEQHITYDAYVAQKQTQMKMHDGKFVNADNVYTSAAYMLAAYEQKGAQHFNAAKADDRARELFGSKAFRVYLDSHPGSLVAASQNMFLDITCNGILDLEKEIEKRDATLGTVSRNLRHAATGKTPLFHKMLNKLERFVQSPVEPSEEERKSLLQSMGEYILKDCAPDSREMDEACFKDTMCAVKALVPADSFRKVLEQVNKGRAIKVQEADFDKPNPEAANEAPERANAMAEPELMAFIQ